MGEVYGVQPIPKQLAKKYGMKRLDSTETHETSKTYLPSEILVDLRTSSYLWMAERQGLQKAVTPIHTPAEITLFDTLSAEYGPSGDWSGMCTIWSVHADSVADIYYKLPEHLESHWKLKTERLAIKTTMDVHRNGVQLVKERLSLRTDDVRPYSDPPGFPGYPIVPAISVPALNLPSTSTSVPDSNQENLPTKPKKKRKRILKAPSSGFYVYNPLTNKNEFILH